MSNNQIPITGWYLENRLPGHHKFYTVLIADNGVVTTSWGRIGTAGQSKVQKFPAHSDAKDVGLRQLYAKKSKGYTAVNEDVKFMVTTTMLNDACSANSASTLDRTFHKALREPRFEGDKKAVFQHYDSFVDQAHKLLDKAGQGMAFEALYVEFEELKSAWSELDDKHSEAAVTIGLAEQTLHQALMGGGK